MSEYHRRRAKDLLVHYFKVVFERAGIPWDGDNIIEIEQIVDEIIQAAIEP
jgi:hypothetical protein